MKTHPSLFSQNKILFTFAFVASFLIWAWSGIELFQSVEARIFWLPTNATLTQVIRQPKSSKATYRYFVDHREYQATLYGLSISSKIGDSVRVFVQPDKPDKSRDASLMPWIILFPPLSATLIGIVATGFSRKGAWRRKQNV